MRHQGPFQYIIRRRIVRSREVSKPREWYLVESDRPEIWQAPRQHCCRGACQMSKRCDNSNYQSRGFETSRDLTIRHLIRYWNRSVLQAISSPDHAQQTLCADATDPKWGRDVDETCDTYDPMMTSSNGNIFRVTGTLCGEFNGDRWMPRTKARDAELWCFLWSAPEWMVE